MLVVESPSSKSNVLYSHPKAARRIVSAPELSGFVVVPNLFPTTFGASVAIAEGYGKNERAMYDGDIDHLADELDAMFRFSDKVRFGAFYNGRGSGHLFGGMSIGILQIGGLYITRL